jgi:hypothetical protein
MPKNESKVGGKKKRRVGGAAKLKQAKYCRLMVYINDKDSDLAEVIDRLCITRDLMPQRGENGVTFLYPKEDSYRKSIVKAMESGNEEEALKMVRSLIIPDYIPDLVDFKRKVVGNRLGVKFKVDTATTSSAKIDPDVELEASDFKWLKRYEKNEQNVNVFNVKKGKLPTSGSDKYAPPLRPRRPAPGERPPKAFGGNPLSKEKVVRDLIEAIKCGKDIEYAASILMIIKAYKPVEFSALVPLLNWEPAVTVLTIIHCGFCDLIPHEFVNFGTPKKYAELLSNAERKDVVDSKTVMSATNAVRQQLAHSSSTTIVSEISGKYSNMATDMSINGFGKVFTIETVKLLMGQSTDSGNASDKKLWLDEMAYIVGISMMLLRRDMDVNTLTSILMDYVCGTRPGLNPKAEIGVIGGAYLKLSVVRNEDFIAIQKFVSSSAFLHILQPLEIAGKESGDPMTDANGYFNIESSAVARLNDAISKQTEDVPSIVNIIAKEYGSKALAPAAT